MKISGHVIDLTAETSKDARIRELEASMNGYRDMWIGQNERIVRAREILEPHRLNPESNRLARVIRDALDALEGK